jgi:hypothetical protein
MVSFLSYVRMFVKLTNSADDNEARPPPVYHYSEIESEILVDVPRFHQLSITDLSPIARH